MKTAHFDYRPYWQEAMTYTEYRDLIDRLLAEGKSTGPHQSESLRHYSELNVTRMKRIDKTSRILTELLREVSGTSLRPIVLVITEGWCGDAAQILPVFQKFAQEAGIESKYILRDAHSALIEQHLTNGSRSIPIILFLHPQTLSLLAAWGPRPQPAQQMLIDWKQQIEPDIDEAELKKNIQLWYARDKQVTMQMEWKELLGQLDH